ncbi:MAG: hypothetical protein M1484_02540 [Patescibacteria group bacterium]|nr:hypothetical protein [Patescibacteria group bacterium]MCL5431959.1 hypothetical protein [Patescibacteria group bacterium]
MGPSEVGDILGVLQFGLLTKLFFSVVGLFYLVFALVVYRQISLMTQVLDSKISPIVKLIALSQILAAAFLFFLAVILA